MLDQFLICWEVDKASLALTVLHVLVRHFGKAGWQWNEVKSELPLLKLLAFPGFVSLLAPRSAFSIGRKITPTVVKWWVRALLALSRDMVCPDKKS